MLEITNEFKREIADAFQFMDNHTTILVDSEIFNAKLKKYDLGPDDVRVVVNEILLNPNLEIYISIIFNKLNTEVEYNIISQIKIHDENAEVHFVKEHISGDLKKLVYKINY